MPALRISDAAARSGVPATTLRYYEDVGLLRPGRTPAGYRIYDERAVEQIRFIAAARRLRLPLEAIAELTQMWQSRPCRSVKQRLRPLIDQQLERLERDRAAVAEIDARLRSALHRLDTLPDRDTACAPTCAFLTEPAPEPGPEPEIACSLTPTDHRDRLEHWTTTLADVPWTATPTGAVLQVPADRTAALASLIVAEQQCCPFLSFRLTFTGPTTQLEITAPEHARTAVLDLVVGARTQTSQ
ncbi:MerR family transcriptional regulator [Nakamurella endophytica]|uniref:MerR family transcriptional regulator n=1 Tax=Nakamurella endophytica TaxID=1748367 RepID=UPI00166E2361|nr:MerR family transcriptional regulator [Nakamurella endophytica]